MAALQIFNLKVGRQHPWLRRSLCTPRSDPFPCFTVPNVSPVLQAAAWARCWVS